MLIYVVKLKLLGVLPLQFQHMYRGGCLTITNCPCAECPRRRADTINDSDFNVTGMYTVNDNIKKKTVIRHFPSPISAASRRKARVASRNATHWHPLGRDPAVGRPLPCWTSLSPVGLYLQIHRPRTSLSGTLLSSKAYGPKMKNPKPSQARSAWKVATARRLVSPRPSSRLVPLIGQWAGLAATGMAR